MTTEQERQAIVDEAHMRLLPIGYWVTAGFWALYALLMGAYFGFFGLVFTAIPERGAGSAAGAPPPQFAWLFVGMGLFFLVVIGGLATAKALAGFWLRQRKHWVGTMIVAGLSCLEVPYGTLLGVLTFMALTRPSVRALYGRQTAHSDEASTPSDSVTEQALPADGGSVVE